MTQSVRLLLGSLRDFRGTTLIRRVRALSRPWPETPHLGQQLQQVTDEDLQLPGGIWQREDVRRFHVTQPCLPFELPQEAGKTQGGAPAP